jgi:hypothetical protein
MSHYENETTCDLCDQADGELQLGSRCHSTAPLQASIERGILTLRCYVPVCGRIVTRFKVIERLDDPENGVH